MPKFKKDKRTRRENAQKMNEIMRARKSGEANLSTTIDNTDNYDEIPADLIVNRTKTPVLEMETVNDDDDIPADVTANRPPLQPILTYSNELNVARARVKTQKLEALSKPGPDLTTATETEQYSEELQISHEEEEKIMDKNIGRRIIAVSHFFSKLQEISNHGPLGCSMSEIRLVGETQNGLQSKFTFKCSLCNMKFVIDSDNCEENYLPINNCAVAGTIAIGCGQSQLEELLSSINLPVISEKTYKYSHDLISDNWEAVAIESMRQAAEKERQLAIAENRISKDGIPLVDVVVDGCWSKRSYKKNYSALSGAAAIIGKETGEILFLGVKNKYCCICASAEKEKVDPGDHRCFKNFDGPSTNMESEILVEGFKQSIRMHNLIYQRMISDGDSNTHAKILKARPYTDITVEKIECRNHVLRNLCNKLQALTTETKYQVKFRKIITKKRILSARAVICKSVKKHKSESDVQLLFEDILKSHLHGFGDHSKCHPYFCDKIGTHEDIPKDFYFSALWQRICFIFQTVASYARSLIHDVDSNIVERFHSVVAKYVGGKRVNFSKRNAYQARCYAAAVSFNKKKSISRLYKKINNGFSPEGKIKRLENKRIHKNLRNKKCKKPKNRTLHKNSKQDHNYGQDCMKPDMPIEEFQTLKERFLENLKKTEEERKTIERKTILQAESSEWLELRRSLLTASNFGKVIKRRNETSCENFVKDLLYTNNIEHIQSIRHGRSHEKEAIQQLEIQEKIKIEPCGLFIDEDMPFLGATPDGLCGQDTIIEIKCPLTAHKLGVDNAIEKGKVNFWTNKKNTWEINKNHSWYYQIQGQLHITQRPKCLFAVWSNENTQLKTELILRDQQFWHDRMKNKLQSFYIDCILPELIDPRYPRGMPIRNPVYIQESINKKTERKKEKENIQPTKENTQHETERDTDKNPHETGEEESMEHASVECTPEVYPSCSRYLNFSDF